MQIYDPTIKSNLAHGLVCWTGKQKVTGSNHSHVRIVLLLITVKTLEIIIISSSNSNGYGTGQWAHIFKLFIIIIYFLSQVFFPPVLLLFNQWCTPPLRLQVSDCSTFLIISDVPSTAVLSWYCFQILF
jgi:hypothetical protein